MRPSPSAWRIPFHGRYTRRGPPPKGKPLRNAHRALPPISRGCLEIEIEIEIERETDRQTDRRTQAEKFKSRHSPFAESGILKNERVANRQTDRQADRQADRQDRQTYRHR